MTCNGPGGSVSSQTTVKVLDIPLFTITPIEINRGQSVRLDWQTRNADSCSASSDPSDKWFGTKPIANGVTKSESITPLPKPPGERKYFLTCNAGSLSITKPADHTLKVHMLLTNVVCSKDGSNFSNCSGIKVVAGSAIWLKDISDPTPDASINSRRWIFTNANPQSISGNTQTVKVSFLKDGEQTATLNVSDSAGATETITKTFKISKPSFQETAPQ